MIQPSDRKSTYHISEEVLEAMDKQAAARYAHEDAHKVAELTRDEQVARFQSNVKASGKQVAGTYYIDMGVQPWDVVGTWPLEQQIGYYRGGALKYVMRLGTKDEQLQEARKAGHYIEKLIEVLERANSQAEKSPGT